MTDVIRNELRDQKRLGAEEREFQVLSNANLTTADRADATSYRAGDVILFHQNAKGFQKGDRLIAGDQPLPLEQSDRFTTFRPGILSLSSGDMIRVTHNGKTKDGQHRLDNGAIFEVKDFTAKGDIRLTNGWTIDKDFGHLNHGYAVTSQASQGKTVDRVLVGISSASFPAASREGFYVAASRGRDSVHIYTDDKRALLDAVNQSDDRLSATEFVSGAERGEALRRIERQRQAARESKIPRAK